MRLLTLVFLVSLIVAPSGFTQAFTPPVAEHGHRPGIVLSPYASGKEIDVTGLEPGSLAKDPHSDRVFRVPEPRPPRAKIFKEQPAVEKVKSPAESVRPKVTGPPAVEPQTPASKPEPKPKPISKPSAPKPVSKPALKKPPTQRVVQAQAPQRGIENFVQSYIKSGESDDPNASASFYAPQVANYFGRKGLSKAQVLSDRVNYLKRYPIRSYELQEAPRILESNADTAKVEARFGYRVSTGSKTYRGLSTSIITLRNSDNRWQITSVVEK